MTPVNVWIGWALAVLAVALGWMLYGWRGVLLAVTMIVFWLLLQFSRALRAMRQAAQSPVGHVASAVMLNAKLKPGLKLMDVVQLTRSLGEAVSDQPEVWRWRDGGGITVDVTFVGGRITTWKLERPAEAAP
jgi:hypothetical protein